MTRVEQLRAAADAARRARIEANGWTVDEIEPEPMAVEIATSLGWQAPSIAPAGVGYVTYDYLRKAFGLDDPPAAPSFQWRNPRLAFGDHDVTRDIDSWTIAFDTSSLFDKLDLDPQADVKRYLRDNGVDPGSLLGDTTP